MKSDITFSKERLSEYLIKIRSEKNTDKLERTINSLKEWLNWLKTNHKISDRDYINTIDQINKITHVKIKHESEKNSQLSSKTFIQSVKAKINIFSISVLLLLIIALISNVYLLMNLKSIQSNLEDKNSLGRVLPFKGNIKETDGNPLDTKRDAIFAIYNIPIGGKELFVGKCIGANALEPSFNGSFTILIGSDCGMKPIPSNIFDDNDTLYLGVKIGSEPELTPRYQIFTSTFSRDTNKLQGLPLGKAKSNVPFINDNGIIELDSESSGIKSLKGEFAIEGGSIHLKSTDEKGDIIIDPALGSNVIVTSGKLGVGTFTPVTILDVSGSNLFNSVADFRNLTTEDDNKTSVLKLSLGTGVDGTDSNFLEFYAGADDKSNGIKVGNIRLNNEGVVFETNGADFAEYFKISSDEEIEVNSIVSISADGIHKSLPNEKILGIVSNTAGFIGNNIYRDGNSVLLALVGQVDVLVTNIGGEIKIGDKVGSTIIPGYGGKVSKDKFGAGYALETSSNMDLTNEQCPNSYKKLRDTTGKRIKCGNIPIVISLD